MSTTKLSSKGQVVIPAAIRNEHGWRPGRTFEVVDTPEGILLKPTPLFPPTRIEDVVGCLKYDGPPITDEDIEKALTEEAKRHMK